jgi:hypothetical protein
MASSTESNVPLNFNQWSARQLAIIPGSEQREYSRYLIDWYKNKSTEKSRNQDAIKQDYVQLVKDLSFLFGQAEKDRFLADVDYTNEEELIFSVPFFARKLKEISKVLSAKREAIKQAKIKYNLIGSNQGLETLLYEYMLKGFTKREGTITQVPALPIQNIFPELSAIKDNFYIEIEELHDPSTYHDSDPSVDIQNYVSLEDVLNAPPFDDPNLTDEEVLNLLTSRFLPRVAPTPLSKVFFDYLSALNTNDIFSIIDTYGATQTITNEIVGTEKYLGETVYGLTAIRLREISTADQVLSLDLQDGNNWFYWPSGTQIVEPYNFNNYFQPILINDSNFISSSATGGTDFSNSDLIFTDKSGVVEGAWLKGVTEENSKTQIQITLPGGTTKEFMFPFVGFRLSTRGFGWDGYAFNDSYLQQFNLLPYSQQKQLLETYYTTNLPNSAAYPVYLNQTQLRRLGFSNIFFDQADNILKQGKRSDIPDVYSDALNDPTEQAYLYRFIRTDIPIETGANSILWPISKIAEDGNLPITVTENDNLPTRLSEHDPSIAMLGAVGGLSFSTSDVIYRLDSRSGDEIEAAWLRAGDVSFLDSTKNTIEVYNTSAVECAVPITGPVQLGLHFRVESGTKMSFVWCGPDTYADEVIYAYSHSADCPYTKNGPHNYYRNQDFSNPGPLNSTLQYEKCNCRAVKYSPIGHAGSVFTDYNGMADVIFADPQGLGNEFAVNSWRDTRGFNVYNSPQFAFFQLAKKPSSQYGELIGQPSLNFPTNEKDIRWVQPPGTEEFVDYDDDGIDDRYQRYPGDKGEGEFKFYSDEEVGWGPGKWLTSAGTRMVLKTGRRYTYYRTSLRKGSNTAPYLVVKYPYKEINSLLCDGACSDIVFVLDASLSQTYVFETVKNIVKQIYNVLLQNAQHQLGLVAFNQDATTISYLSQDAFALRLLTSLLSPSGKTNITDGLLLAEAILTTRIPEESIENNDLFALCRQLNVTIASCGAGSVTVNEPRNSCRKRIIIFSDGEANIEQDSVITTANRVKNNGIEIISIDIGTLGLFNNNMEEIATNSDLYFNLQQYLLNNDGDDNSFANFIAQLISDCPPIKPTWCKAIKGSTGEWIETNEVSDMILYPGDYLSYTHQGGVFYTSPVDSSTNFNQTGIDFTINVKLNGWDYTTNTFYASAYGSRFGSKPFWGTAYNVYDEDNSYYKESMAFGGHIRFFNDYVPVKQPEISPLVLENGNLIKYTNRSPNNLNWQEYIDIKITDTERRWNKIEFYKDVSNLANLLKVNNLDVIAYPSMEPSTLTLESYSQFKPAYYNYFAQNSFKFNQDLFYADRCENSFVIFNSAVIINPLTPSANLDNRFYPTIASISYPHLAVSERQVGEYMVPDTLGTPTWRGRGYKNFIDPNRVSILEAASAEEVFLDLNKYSSRNRGLTKKDQLSPITTYNISNDWIAEPYSACGKAGVILGTKENQKFTPYQTSYEILNKNYYGITRQEDSFEFWTPANPATWNEPVKYPLTFRKELEAATYKNRIDNLLVNKGKMSQWKTDIFGYDYGLFKKSDRNDPFFNDVVLLLPMNANFQDFSKSANSISIFGTPSIVPFSQRPDNGGYFDSSGDYLSISDTPNLGLGTQNFTIEMWIFKSTALVNWNGIFELGTGINPYQNGLMLRLQSTTTDSLYIANVAYNWSPSSNFPLNQWNHLALVRNGNSFTVYVNGNSVLSVTNSANLGSTSRITIGASAHSTTQGLDGFIDDFRITKGIARYTTNFTPPTNQFPTS